MGLKRGLEDIARLSHIVNVLFTEGLGFLIEDLKLKHHLPFHRKVQKGKFKKPDISSAPVRLRKVFEKLGGTYVKLGQLLSIRPDLVTPEFSEELKKLQDEVPSFPFKEVKAIIESELKEPLDRIFSSFEEKPTAAASIAQVHKAVLKNGKHVVVKVQRPHVKDIIDEDIDIMYYLAHKIQNNPKYKNFSPVGIIDEFSVYTKREMDFTNEAKNITLFYNNFKDYAGIKIPFVYWDYVTPRVLIMDYFPGRKLSKVTPKTKGVDGRVVAITGFNALLKMIFEDGLFHADLHPGNIIITGHKVGIVDFGIVGFLDDNLRSKAILLLASLLNQDSKQIMKVLLEVGEKSPNTNLIIFEDDITKVVMQWHYTSPNMENATQMLHRLFNVCMRNDIRMPTNLVLLGKAMVTAEATCRQVYPEFDVIEQSKPYIEKYLSKKLEYTHILKKMITDYAKIKEGLIEVPRKASKIADTIAKGSFRLDMTKDIDHLSLEIDRSSNRLSMGMLIAGFVVSGALILQSNLKPYLWGYPVLSVICFGMAVFFGMMLSISIVNEGKK